MHMSYSYTFDYALIFVYYYSIIKILMSVLGTFTIVMSMLRVPTQKGPTTVRATVDMKEMDLTVQVHVHLSIIFQSSSV